MNEKPELQSPPTLEKPFFSKEEKSPKRKVDTQAHLQRGDKLARLMCERLADCIMRGEMPEVNEFPSSFDTVEWR